MFDKRRIVLYWDQLQYATKINKTCLKYITLIYYHWDGWVCLDIQRSICIFCSYLFLGYERTTILHVVCRLKCKTVYLICLTRKPAGGHWCHLPIGTWPRHVTDAHPVKSNFIGMTNVHLVKVRLGGLWLVGRGAMPTRGTYKFNNAPGK